MRLKSKILVETKNPKKLFKIFMNTLLGVIVLLLLFKIWMDDFKATDISGLLIPLLIYFQFLGVNKKTDIYAECDADVEFLEDALKITYLNVNGGKKKGLFTEVVTIKYRDIQNIEYTEEACGYVFTSGNYDLKRTYDSGEREEVVLHPGFEHAYVIYVLEPDEASDFKNKLEKITGKQIKYVTTDYEDTRL